MRRRNFISASIAAIVAMMIGKKSEAKTRVYDVGTYLHDTGPEILCFLLTDGKFKQIPWDSMKRGDEVITLAITDGELLLLDSFKPLHSPIGATGSVGYMRALDLLKVAKAGLAKLPETKAT